MNLLDQRLCAWGGVFCAVIIGAGLLLAGFVPPRSPGAFAYMFRTGPFAWNGLLAFWLAASAFFAWLITMMCLTLRAISAEANEVGASTGFNPALVAR